MSDILLVGDRPQQLRAIAAALAPLDHELVSAGLGQDALGKLAEHDITLVVLDGEGDWAEALETARLIKRDGHRSDVPVLFLARDPPAAPAPAPTEDATDTEAAAAPPPPARGHWLGAVDYVVSASDAELLRSRVAGLADLEASRLALKRSEALIRGAFEAAPIGKTVLDAQRRIVRANPAFAALLARTGPELLGTDIATLAHPDDRARLRTALRRVAQRDLGPDHPDRSGFDVRLNPSTGVLAWTSAYVSAIDPAELDEPLLMIQWVDMSARRHAEQARAQLRLEYSARAQAEATAERLEKLHVLTDALEALALDELLPELALRLADQFEAEMTEISLRAANGADAVVVRAAGGRVLEEAESAAAVPAEAWREMPLEAAGAPMGSIRLVPGAGTRFADEDLLLLAGFAERAALSIRRAQLHEQEHEIAAVLQRGLLPTKLPRIAGLDLTAHYEPAGDVAEVGGDWYDAFALHEDRLGFVLGDVAGKGIRAASTMGQLRSVARAFALGDEQNRPPGEVLTRLNRYQLALGASEVFTVLYAVVDPAAGTLAWANAGHLPPLLRSGGGQIRYLEGGEGLMGLDDIEYADLEVPLARHDTLIFYTDGLVERRGESLDAGLERLAAAVARGPRSPEALCRHLIAELAPPDGSPPDDMTIVVARIR